MLGQYHAEGGVTDGRYALYNSNAERVEQVLAQIKVGRGSEIRMSWGRLQMLTRRGGTVVLSCSCKLSRNQRSPSPQSCTVTLMTWGYYGTFHARITPLTLMFSLVPIPCR